MTDQMTIRKDEIIEYHDLIGFSNRFAVTIDGTQLKAGSVRFLGFCGHHVGGGIYEGVLTYADADGTEEQIDDFPTAKDLTDA